MASRHARADFNVVQMGLGEDCAAVLSQALCRYTKHARKAV